MISKCQGLGVLDNGHRMLHLKFLFYRLAGRELMYFIIDVSFLTLQDDSCINKVNFRRKKLYKNDGKTLCQFLTISLF